MNKIIIITYLINLLFISLSRSGVVVEYLKSNNIINEGASGIIVHDITSNNTQAPSGVIVHDAINNNTQAPSGVIVHDAINNSTEAPSGVIVHDAINNITQAPNGVIVHDIINNNNITQAPNTIILEQLIKNGTNPTIPPSFYNNNNSNITNIINNTISTSYINININKNNNKINKEEFKNKIINFIENNEKDEIKNRQYKNLFINYILNYDDKINHYNNSNNNINIINKYNLYIESDKYIKKLNQEYKKLYNIDNIYDHTKFSDWSIEEKKSILINQQDMLNTQSLLQTDCINFKGWQGSIEQIKNKTFENVAQPVQDQGSECGSCWAFSSIAQYELNYYLYKNKYEKQSEQYVLNCIPDNSKSNCTNGYPTKSNLFLGNYGSCSSNNYYTYDGKDIYTCSNCFNNKTELSNVYCINKLSTGYNGNNIKFWNIIANTAQYVGLSFWMGISNNFFYLKSNNPYFYDCGTTNDIIAYHAMSIHGVSEGGNYLYVKNSWGTEWGLNGYFWLSKNSISSCNFQPDVSFNSW